ncbi:MAG: hypothetical protein U9Q66_00635 [Patescibacteria group bacterium]|nr:hypothetical protein [Patescibacteria group bacterium]
MFLFIFYFAVSKTYVEITPEINIKVKAKNITFKEHFETEEKIIQDINIMKLKKVNVKVNLESIFQTT